MEGITVYDCKDGRQRAYLKSSKKIVSYPRLLLENKLGIKLLPHEQAHHKDEDVSNNCPENLELKPIGEHQRMHSTKYNDKWVRCGWCGTKFIWTAKQQSTFARNKAKRNTNIEYPFCSKRCVGLYGKQIQKQNK